MSVKLPKKFNEKSGADNTAELHMVMQASESNQNSFNNLDGGEQVLAIVAMFFALLNGENMTVDNSKLPAAMGFETTEDFQTFRQENAEKTPIEAAKVHDYSKFDTIETTNYVNQNLTNDHYAAFLEHLKLREGIKNEVYSCSEGKLTVGVGHLVLPSDNLKLGDTISDEQINSFLSADAMTAYNAAIQQANEAGIKDPKFINALASVNYQLGTAWNKDFKQTWSKIVSGDYQGAIDNLEKSLWNRQTPVRVDDFQTALADLPPKNTTKGPVSERLAEVSEDCQQQFHSAANGGAEHNHETCPAPALTDELVV